MASSAELEAQMEKQQADYLQRLENSGQLPKIISDAWTAAGGGAENKALKDTEAKALTDYIGAGANARAKYQEVWNPFSREQLVAKEIQSAYKPIADVRTELAMRAEALNIATQSSVAMYNADTQKAGTALDFTKSAYDRAWQREQEAKREQERKEELALEYAKLAKSGSGSKTLTEAEKKAALANQLQEWLIEDKKAGITKPFWREARFDQLASEFPEYKDYIYKVGYTIYKDNWEK